MGSGNLSLRELGNPPLRGSSLTNICHNDLVEPLEKLVLETKAGQDGLYDVFKISKQLISTNGTI